jgi:ankyrin repeat protein
VIITVGAIISGTGAAASGVGASVTAQDEEGRTALIAAAYQNNLSVTDLLIPP